MRRLTIEIDLAIHRRLSAMEREALVEQVRDLMRTRFTHVLEVRADRESGEEL